MTLVLDSGAFLALERNERGSWVRMKTALSAGDPPITHAGVVAQVWRGGARQARLAVALAATTIQPLDERIGRAAGTLLASTGLSDVIDATVALISKDGDDIVTTDPDDLEVLVAALGRHVELLRP